MQTTEQKTITKTTQKHMPMSSDQNYLYKWSKPIFTTYVFELKKQWKKAIIFSLIGAAFVFLLSFLPYALIPDNPLPENQIIYFQNGLNFLTMLTIFSSCFFFGGIICEEYSKKTGHIVFPIINRYKILTGKFLASFTLLTSVLASFYFSLTYLSIFFYNTVMLDKIFLSFSIALLYALAVSSFVTLLSSMMKSVNMAIVTSIMVLLIANMIVDSLITLWLPEIEPMYSLNHMSKLITQIMESDFPTKLSERYTETSFGGGPPGRGAGAGSEFVMRQWITPSMIGGISIALGYTIVCVTIALIIFKRRQI
jgi:ABC-type transport system involved in multi-copper enzyme maturation permease subunit